MTERDVAHASAIRDTSTFLTTNAARFQPALPERPDTPALGNVRALALALQRPKTSETDPGGVIARLGTFALKQATGATDFHGGTTLKETRRNGLLLDLRGLNKSAGAIASKLKRPEIMDGFRMPHGNNDAGLIIRARSFGVKAIPLSSEFILLGHAEDFLAHLEADVVAFEHADVDQEKGRQGQSGGTSALPGAISEGLGIMQQLDATMHNLLADDAALLGQWVTASHIERPSKKKKPKASEGEPPKDVPPKG